MITTQCAICGKDEKLKTLYKSTLKRKKITASTFSARRTPDRMHYRFVVCLRCGLQFSNPILPLKEIVKFYQDSTFEYTPESGYLKKTYGKYLRKLLSGKKAKQLSLLDIGCGNGFFLEEARAMGVGHVYGIEPGKESVEKADSRIRKQITMNVFKKGQFKDSTFDIISCFHTLDHIVDINIFLDNVYKALKKGGKVYFIVHDTNGLSVRLFGEKSPIFDIEHIYLFNSSTLKKIFEKHRFRVLQTFSIENSYPMRYWLRMAPLPRLMKSALQIILTKTHIIDHPISIKAGNIGIVAEK